MIWTYTSMYIRIFSTNSLLDRFCEFRFLNLERKLVNLATMAIILFTKQLKMHRLTWWRYFYNGVRVAEIPENKWFPFLTPKEMCLCIRLYIVGILRYEDSTHLHIIYLDKGTQVSGMDNLMTIFTRTSAHFHTHFETKRIKMVLLDLCRWNFKFSLNW